MNDLSDSRWLKQTMLGLLASVIYLSVVFLPHTSPPFQLMVYLILRQSPIPVDNPLERRKFMTEKPYTY